ncbi:TPA: hypothetical protein ACPSKB_000894 [Legionella feeleii]
MPQKNNNPTNVPAGFYWSKDSYFLKGADLIFKTSITSLTTSLITAPITLLLSNKQLSTTIKPTPLAFAKSSWQIFQSQAIANQKRGAVSVTSKHINKENGPEGVPTQHKEEAEPIQNYNSFFTSLTFSQADTALGSVFNNRAKILSGGIVKPVKLTGYNIRQLFLMGYPVKSLSNFMSFTALLTLSDSITNQLPIENSAVANFVGGGLAGAVSSLLTHPLNASYDRIILGTRMDSEAKLIRVSSLSFFKEKMSYAKTISLGEIAQNFWLITRNELPVRMLSTITIFSIIQGFNYLMGDRPVSHFLPADPDNEPGGGSHLSR